MTFTTLTTFVLALLKYSQIFLKYLYLLYNVCAAGALFVHKTKHSFLHNVLIYAVALQIRHNWIRLRCGSKAKSFLCYETFELSLVQGERNFRTTRTRAETSARLSFHTQGENWPWSKNKKWSEHNSTSARIKALLSCACSRACSAFRLAYWSRTVSVIFSRQFSKNLVFWL